MTVENQKNSLNARIAILVFSIISLALVIYKLILLGFYEGTITSSAIISEILHAIPKAVMILYLALLCKAGRAKVVPFILFILLIAINFCFGAVGNGIDLFTWLSKGETLADRSMQIFLGNTILSALMTVAFVLLMIGTQKSFAKPIFSIVPLCILMVSAGIMLGFYGFLAIKPIVEQIGGEVPSYDSHGYVLGFVAALSTLFFYLAIGLFVLKNRDFTVRSAPAEEAKAE